MKDLWILILFAILGVIGFIFLIFEYRTESFACVGDPLSYLAEEYISNTNAEDVYIVVNLNAKGFASKTVNYYQNKTWGGFVNPPQKENEFNNSVFPINLSWHFR